jgi:hypothetical protein
MCVPDGELKIKTLGYKKFKIQDICRFCPGDGRSVFFECDGVVRRLCGQKQSSEPSRQLSRYLSCSLGGSTDITFLGCQSMTVFFK